MKEEERMPGEFKAKVLKRAGSRRNSEIYKGQWRNGYIIKKHDGTLILVEEICLIYNETRITKYLIDRNTLCMRTGYYLHKPHESIWQSRTSLYEKDYILNEIHGKGIIIWDENKEEFIVKMENGKILSIGEIQNNSILIGNYYDNPNLLDDKKKYMIK